MDDTLLPEGLCAPYYPSTAFRVCVGSPQYPTSRPYGLCANGFIEAENSSWAPTERMARYHLLWRPIPTPFVSIFGQYRRALDWAEMLERKGNRGIYIVVIDTYTLPVGQLWDAHAIAIHLGFPSERVQFHQDEYLFYGSIYRERILAVLPAMGSRIQLAVHLGTLTLPQSCIDAIGSTKEGVVKEG